MVNARRFASPGEIGLEFDGSDSLLNVPLALESLSDFPVSDRVAIITSDGKPNSASSTNANRKHTSSYLPRMRFFCWKVDFDDRINRAASPLYCAKVRYFRCHVIRLPLVSESTLEP